MLKMMNLKNNLLSFSILIGLCACLSCNSVKSNPFHPRNQKIKIAGGDIYSFSIGLSALMCQIISEENDQCQAQATSGTQENLRRLQERENDFAIIPEYALKKFFYKKDGTYANMNLRGLLYLGYSSFYLVVPENAPHQKLSDLKTIRIEGSDISAERALETLSKSYEFKCIKTKSIIKSIEKFCQSQDEALAFMDTSPSFLITLIKKSCPIREIKLSEAEMNAAINQEPTFKKVKDSFIAPFRKLASSRLATRLIFITHDAIPGDIIKNILDEVKENFFFIQVYHPSLSDLTLLGSFKDLPIPEHLGVTWFLQSLAKALPSSVDIPISQYIPKTLDVISDKTILEKRSMDILQPEFNQTLMKQASKKEQA